MPVLTTRDWDPTGELTASPQKRDKTQDILSMIRSTMDGVTAAKQKQNNEAYRRAAMQDLNSGNSAAEYDYDPTTGQMKVKISPKKEETQADKMRRAVYRQQFGVDPVTGEEVPSEELRKPRFGYNNNPLMAILSDPAALSSLLGEEEEAGGSTLQQTQIPQQAAPQMQQPAFDPRSVAGIRYTPQAQAAPMGNPQIEIPGQGAQFLDPLELEAQNAILKGADPKLVRARMQQLREQAGNNGSV